MPFAGFEDWDDCMKKQSRYYSTKVAEKVCGKLKSKYEKAIEESDLSETPEVNEETEKDQLGSVGYGGMIDANQQIKRQERITGTGKKKLLSQFGDFGDHGGV